jgi:hypothetical protein
MLKSCEKHGARISLPEGSEQLQDVFHRRISLQVEGLDWHRERFPCGQGRGEAPPAQRQGRAAPQAAARRGFPEQRDPAGPQPARHEGDHEGVFVRCDDGMQRRHEIVEGCREACRGVCLHLAGVDR